MTKPKIYSSIVSLKSDWKERFREATRLDIKEVSLFMTTLILKERKRFYRHLKESGIEFVPHVHIRHDFTEKEVQWLVDTYGVKYFTIHIQNLKKFSKWKLAKKICVEYNPTLYNGKMLDDLKYIDRIAGFCIDITHYHIAKRYRYDKSLKIVEKLLKKYPVVINHLNGFTKKNTNKIEIDDMHFIKNMNKNFWHLENTPKKLFSKNIYIECSNAIPKQLKIIDYLYKNYF